MFETNVVEFEVVQTLIRKRLAIDDEQMVVGRHFLLPFGDGIEGC